VSAPATATHSPEFASDAATERSAMRLFEPHGSTLEDMVLGAWEDLVAGNPAECPVCGGHMRAAGGCEDCGSDLS
jgi:tRNA(Ile2) C34 agmatinyltransferase TiaS